MVMFVMLMMGIDLVMGEVVVVMVVLIVNVGKRHLVLFVVRGGEEVVGGEGC